MKAHPDPLAAVVAELERRVGELPRVAKDCGISYDTVLRIKNRENDPGYSKVRALYEYLFAANDDEHGPDSAPAPLAGIDGGA